MKEKFEKILGEALMVYMVLEIHQQPGKLYRTISVAMNTRNGTIKARAKRPKDIGRQIYVNTNLSEQKLVSSMYPEEITELLLKNLAHEIIRHLRKNTARMVDLKESWFERLKFLFNTNEKEI